MRELKWTLLLGVVATLVTATAGDAQITVNITKEIETGSDATAVFDFPGVPGSPLGNGETGSYVFGPGGTSLVFEQPPDASWDAPTITCVASGGASAAQTGFWEVTITDQSGGTTPGTADCTYINSQGPMLTVAGTAAATSFTGDGASLTGVPDDVTHGTASFNCAAGTTCFVVNDCPAGFEITGGGFFIGSGDLPTRELVTLHQSYRATASQWLAEATNGSGVALDFYALAECTRVPAAPLAPASASASASAMPPGLELSRLLLVCPESDAARFVELRDAGGAHFCPQHGLALEPSGGGSSAMLPASTNQEISKVEAR